MLFAIPRASSLRAAFWLTHPRNSVIPTDRNLQVTRPMFSTSTITPSRLANLATLRHGLFQPTIAAVVFAASLAVTSLSQAVDRWEAIPMVTQGLLNSSISPGGEGGQWIQAITIDSTGNFLLMMTDAGGIFRSLDGGGRWNPCNVGFYPRGGNAVAIDPNNSNYCLAEGSGIGSDNGIYYSQDQGGTWATAMLQTLNGSHEYRDMLTYDRSSLSGGRSLIAYYLSDLDGLYKSSNGGASWTKVNASYTQGHVKTHPTAGYVYIGVATGFYKSTNQGASFTQTLAGAVSGIDVCATAPNSVWVTLPDGVYKSTDSGSTFTKLPGNGLPTTAPLRLAGAKVSPANTQHMVAWWQGDNFDFRRFYSTDGGSNWTQSTFNLVNTTFPYNPRQACECWHPTDPLTLWNNGDDFITKSTDGGATYVWAANGYTGIANPTHSAIAFNVTNPDLLLMALTDHNGAFTQNGGASWTYAKIEPFGWGGEACAGYAISSTRLVGRDSVNHMRISQDGGVTFADTGNVLAGQLVSNGDPTNSNVVFCCNWRSGDSGSTWAAMPGCDGVFTFSAGSGHELYGSSAKSIVKSTDHGVTWQTITTLTVGIRDVAYDHVHNYVYIVAGDFRLHRWDGASLTTLNTPVDQHGNWGVMSVAVDPVNPSIVYVASEGINGSSYASTVSVVRSVDAGGSWQGLTSSVSANVVVDGGHEANWVRVHPLTRYAYFGTGCYGMWKMAPPASYYTEAEGLTEVASSGDALRAVTSPSFNADQGVVYDSNAVGDYVTLLVSAVPAGNYDLRVGVKKFNGRGIFQAAIAAAGGSFLNHGTPQDLYSATEYYTEIDLGALTIGTTGEKWFRFTVTGKNASSSGYDLSFDYIKLIAK